MTVTVTSQQQTTLESRSFGMALFGSLDFSGGIVRVTTWNHDLVWGGYTWTGLGNLVSVQEVKESEKLETQVVDLVLNAANQSILALSLGEAEVYRGRSAIIYMCPMTNGALVDTPILCWQGFMDTMAVSYSGDGSGSIVVRCKPASDRLSRPSGLRVNAEQQKLILSSDLGFQYLDDLIANPQVWLSKKFQEI